MFIALSNIVFGYSQTFKNLSVKDGLSDLVVNALYKDSLGYIWVGTSKSVERYDGVIFKNYHIPAENPKAREVNVITGMPDNEIWFGNNSGVWKVEGDTISRMFRDKIDRSVLSMLYDVKTGKLFCGSDAGLYICKGDSVNHIVLDRNIYSGANIINSLAIDDNILWMATSGGLYSMDLSDESIESYSFSGMTDVLTEICCVNGVLYLGTKESGIISFDLNKKVFSSFANIGHITSLSTNENNILYASTNGGGIYFISLPDGGIVRRIQHDTVTGSGIRSNSVYSLLVDRDGIV